VMQEFLSLKSRGRVDLKKGVNNER
jgi:hypothetical protein